MNRHIVFRIVSALVLLVVLVALGGFAFQAGFARGAVANIQAPSGETNYVIPYYGFYPHFFPGFGFFGLFIPIFLFFMAFGLLRRVIWGPRWYGRHMRHGSWRGQGPWGEGVPPMFAEWHKRAHGETPAEEKSEQ